MTTLAAVRALAQRLDRRHGGSCGKDCPPLVLIVCNDFFAGGDNPIPLPCPRCGRPPTIIQHVYDDQFYDKPESGAKAGRPGAAGAGGIFGVLDVLGEAFG